MVAFFMSGVTSLKIITIMDLQLQWQFNLYLDISQVNTLYSEDQNFIKE